jgi:hypothetical protein
MFGSARAVAPTSTREGAILLGGASSEVWNQHSDLIRPSVEFVCPKTPLPTRLAVCAWDVVNRHWWEAESSGNVEASIVPAKGRLQLFNLDKIRRAIGHKAARRPFGPPSARSDRVQVSHPLVGHPRLDKRVATPIDANRSDDDDLRQSEPKRDLELRW